LGYAPAPTAAIIAGILNRYHELAPGASVTLHDFAERDLDGQQSKETSRRVNSSPETSRNAGTPDELIKALKRYLQESGESERAIASRIRVNRHNLHRWFLDNQSPKRGKLALTAFFLRRVEYL
jgi:hypothetical protein